MEFFNYHIIDGQSARKQGFIKAPDKDKAIKTIRSWGAMLISLDSVLVQEPRIKNSPIGFMILMINDSKIKFLENKVNEESKLRFKNRLFDFVLQDKLPLENTAILEGLKNTEHLNDEEIKAIKIEVYRLAFAQAIKDWAISEEDERRLNNIQEFLGIKDTEIRINKKLLNRYRLLDEIRKGNLPIIPNFLIKGIVLREDEKVYWSELASLIEEQVINTYYEGRFSGMSLIIGMALGCLMSDLKGHPVIQKGNIATSEGKLVLTNKRIIFSGDRKSFSVNLDEMLDLTFYSDGLQFTETKKSDTRVIRFNGSFEFQDYEFDRTMRPEELLRAIGIRSRVYIPTIETPLKSLNNLLEDQGLYKVMRARPKDSWSPVNICRLENGQRLSLLEIKELNRLLIEENFPSETPKRAMNGLETIKIVSAILAYTLNQTEQDEG